MTDVDESEIGDAVNAEDSMGLTALYKACGEGDLAAVKNLVERGADLEIGSDTPLRRAAWDGYTEIVAFLLDNGAAINAKNLDGCTALHHACDDGHLAVVKELLKHGADIDHGSFTPLMGAIENGNCEIVAFLLDEGAAVNAQNGGDTALGMACQSYLAVVKELVNHGADLELGTDTPLRIAAWEGETEIVAFLLDRGAAVNAENEDGHTALYVACQEGYLAVAEELVNHGADLELGTDTPLMGAALKGHTKTVSWLIKKGADVNTRNKQGMTALQCVEREKKDAGSEELQNLIDVEKILIAEGGHA